jgi:hypothetical protein
MFQSNPNQPVPPGQLDPDVEVALDIQVAAASYYVATGKPANIRMYWASATNLDGIASAIEAASNDDPYAQNHSLRLAKLSSTVHKLGFWTCAKGSSPLQITVCGPRYSMYLQDKVTMPLNWGLFPMSQHLAGKNSKIANLATLNKNFGDVSVNRAKIDEN